MIATLLQIAALFSLLSLLAVGGGAGVIPDMQRATVDAHHWMTASQFLDAFAISRAAPGPGSLIVLLVGNRAAGIVGAVVALIAMFGPSSVLAYVAARSWRRAGNAPWRLMVEQALAPVAVGLTIASGLALLRGTEHGWVEYAVTGVSTLIFAVSEPHPLILLLLGGAVVLAVG